MAAPTFFQHNEIAGVISNVVEFNPFLLQFFGREYVTDDQQINFDRVPMDRRIAPIVSPLVPGKTVKMAGYKTSVFTPAYIKDKFTVEPNHVFTRRPGEPMGQPLSNAERYAATVIDQGAQALTRLNRRLEQMASNLLIAGSYTVTGDTASYSVDFERPAGNTLTLTGAEQWIAANSTISPIQTLENALERAKYPIRTIVMGTYAWAWFRKDAQFKDLIYSLYQTGGQSTMQFGPQQKNLQGVTYRGTLASINADIYTYADTYTDETTGTETYYLPQDYVLLLPSPEYGWRCYASIQDVAANYSGMPYFFKNWQEEDPGMPFLMLQSAPMLAHTRMDSTVCIQTGAVQLQGGK